MTPLDIQYELRKREITQKALAGEIGVSEMTVSNVIRRRSTSHRVMKAIAAKIGRDHQVVFADYYFGKNRRKSIS